MHLRSAVVMLSAVVGVARAADRALTYGQAQEIWEASKNKPEYQSYAQEFAQFNNYFHLDERDGCYKRQGRRVELMLIITHRAGNHNARIKQVLTETDSPKARCFKKTYGGIDTKIPPFSPFVLQMSMG
jgi:hypothetical protein